VAGGGFKVLIQKIDGVEVEYFIPINNASGDNGLLDDDANVAKLEHYVGGTLTNYWWSHASGTGGDAGIPPEIFTANIAEFDGTNKGLNLPDGFVDHASDFTVGLRFTANVTGGIKALFRVHESTDNRVVTPTVTVSDLGLLVIKITTPVDIIEYEYESLIRYDDALPHTVVVAHQLSTKTLTYYVDGVEVFTDTYVQALRASTWTTIGKTRANYTGHTGDSYHSGTICDFQYYDAYLSDTQVQAMYPTLDPITCSDLLDVGVTPRNHYPAYNYIGFVNQELVDIQGNAVDLVESQAIAVPFTGTSDLECGVYVPSADLWFKTSGSVLNRTPNVQFSLANWLVSTGDLYEGVSSPSITIPDTAEYLIEVTDFDPLLCTGAFQMQNDSIVEMSDLSAFSEITSLRLDENFALQEAGSFSTMTKISSAFYINDCDWQGLRDVPVAPSMTNLRFQNNSGLTSITTILGCLALVEIRGEGCALDSTTVGNLITDTDTNGASNGTMNISGGTNALVPLSAQAALTSLLGKGWTVTHNGLEV